ncbi:hypothetical protein EBA01_14310 [Xanthomonas oryzae pv. oryzae]|nr:hypothetical protein BVV16_14465 [Xanthomonas oryzae pv. oryzae]OWB27456.1 hypothetical protein XocBAI15_09110 [Xanthomonas oryzae pv. oryzicola]QBG87788.1 hypothetical protein EYC54_08560 [Xanthomonas oryzae]AUI94763.1 hypothetical protein BVV17_14470 [Xanthomonas oryzae pv. oryzae]AUI98435.1 hypothetical protein BVV18_14475 [Xanthomonas oryzae pv. oryzae]
MTKRRKRCLKIHFVQVKLLSLLFAKVTVNRGLMRWIVRSATSLYLASSLQSQPPPPVHHSVVGRQSRCPTSNARMVS